MKFRMQIKQVGGSPYWEEHEDKRVVSKYSAKQVATSLVAGFNEEFGAAFGRRELVAVEFKREEPAQKVSP